MSLRNPIRYLLLLLFTLLQCVAPLAHAHVNGNHAAHNVHIALVGAHEFAGHQHNDIGIVPHSAHEHDTSVVCMPPESRAATLIIDLPMLSSQHGLLPKKEPVSNIFDELYQLSVTSTPYSHPFSQAPPL